VTDRDPYGADPDPTEAFPPLPDDPTPTPPADLPPIGSDRDPDPTRVMPPTQGDVPTTAMPAAGGPYDAGPPYVVPPGGGGGGGEPPYEPPYEPEPDPWYLQPGPLAALIAGIAAVIVGVIALIVWTGDDDGGISGETLPSVATTSSSSSTTTSTVPATTTTTSTTAPATTTTTSSTTTTTTTTTTVPPTTTTTLPPTTTTTTTAPTTTTTAPPPPPGQGLLDELRADEDLSTFAGALECTGLDEDVLAGAARTVLAPTNDVFTTAGLDPCADVDATEPILLLHLVSIDLDDQAVFGADTLQTLGGQVDVNRTSQEIGPNGAQITASTQAGDGWVHTIDQIIS
jgi:uncharacterized surface protein with fasciclin (FAS1) repeats